MEQQIECPMGHFNPRGNVHCGVCGKKLEPTASADVPAEAKPRGRRWIAWVVVGALVAVVVVGMLISGSGNDGSTDDYAADDDYGEETVPELTTEEICVQEISSWLDYVTGPGSSLTDGMAEFGMQSPAWTVLNQAYRTFQVNVYQVGVDKASAMAVTTITDGCNRIGDQYEIGHLAPN